MSIKHRGYVLKGDVQIRNDGVGSLNFAGKINTTDHRVTLVNEGLEDMNISGSIKTTGAPIVILNRGNKMTVTETATLNSGRTGTLYDNGTVEPVISPNATIHNMNGSGNLNGQHWD